MGYWGWVVLHLVMDLWVENGSPSEMSLVAMAGERY